MKAPREALRLGGGPGFRSLLEIDSQVLPNSYETARRRWSAKLRFIYESTSSVSAEVIVEVILAEIWKYLRAVEVPYLQLETLQCLLTPVWIALWKLQNSFETPWADNPKWVAGTQMYRIKVELITVSRFHKCVFYGLSSSTHYLRQDTHNIGNKRVCPFASTWDGAANTGGRGTQSWGIPLEIAFR